MEVIELQGDDDDDEQEVNQSLQTQIFLNHFTHDGYEYSINRRSSRITSDFFIFSRFKQDFIVASIEKEKMLARRQ